MGTASASYSDRSRRAAAEAQFDFTGSTSFAGKQSLKALAPLATREGCVNSVSTVLGEIERAARTPAELIEIITARGSRSRKRDDRTRGITQIDFDNEIALIYSTYTELLNQNLFTEEDADQLRAVWVLRGLIDGRFVHVPWLSKVQLLHR